jgi:hypothetical protein
MLFLLLIFATLVALMGSAYGSASPPCHARGGTFPILFSVARRFTRFRQVHFFHTGRAAAREKESLFQFGMRDGGRMFFIATLRYRRPATRLPVPHWLQPMRDYITCMIKLQLVSTTPNAGRHRFSLPWSSVSVRAALRMPDTSAQEF